MEDQCSQSTTRDWNNGTFKTFSTEIACNQTDPLVFLKFCSLIVMMLLLGTSREERVGSVYRTKRSRCIYLQTESNKFSERKFSHPQPLKVSPSSFGTDNSSSIQSGSADKNTPSGSMGSKSSNSDYWNEKRDEAIKGNSLFLCVFITWPRSLRASTAV